MSYFNRLTTGHTVVMGRKTYDSLDAPLRARRNVVVTRDRAYHSHGVTVVHSLTEALRVAEGEDEVFVAGGGEIYAAALPYAHRLYLTVIHAQVEGDVYFPVYDAGEWTLIEDERNEPDERHTYAFSFRLYERRCQ